MTYAYWPYGWNPVRDLARLHREMKDLIGGRGLDRWFGAAEYPPMNLHSAGDDLVLSLELPGMKMEDIDISVTGNTLTVKGEAGTAAADEAKQYHRRERGTGSFVRAVNLPGRVDPEKAEARYVNGVLTVRLPKAEEAKARRVTVSGS